ncbi:uncharacterized protein LOC130647026 isoform X2 [Hydractinia symbiolongicarpus]|uniref:uncharacterized protein LOC130647026 isoform X2 n=1 Tax=Hydractinia symbiolongicarpus TaxID=13093 RepID=UPI00254D5300|nr:uncharacterized protein LOC130647026 isoform X2 [Hydractinia symbiolongicarpus]
MDTIQKLVDSCKYAQAKEIIKKGFMNIKEPIDAVYLKMVANFLEIKQTFFQELEHKNLLQLTNIQASIENYTTLGKEIADFKISEEMLKIECTCLTNLISLINATDTCENQNKTLLHMLYQHLKKLCIMFWNSTSDIPCLFVDNECNNLKRTVELLQYVLNQIAGTFRDHWLIMHYFSLSIDILFWLIKSHKSVDLQSSLIHCITCLLHLKSDIFQNNDCEGRGLDFCFNRRSFKVFKRDFASIKLLCKVVSKYSLNGEDVYQNSQTKDVYHQINNLAFTIEGIRLFQNCDYAACCQHIEEVCQSTVATSQLSGFQLTLIKNIKKISQLKLGRSASFSDSPLSSIVLKNFANLLNQAGLCFMQKEDDRSIELLYKLLEMIHKLNEKIYVVSNFEYNVDEFLKCHTELVRLPTNHCNWIFFAYLNLPPLAYILNKLSILLFRQKRYEELNQIMKKFVYEVEKNPTSNGESVDCIYRMYCSSLLKSSRFNKAQELIVDMQEKGYFWAWHLLYLAEVLRQQKNYKESIEQLQRLLNELDKKDNVVKDENNNGCTWSLLDVVNFKEIKTYHAYNNMAVACIEQGVVDDALMYLKMAIQECRKLRTDVITEVVYNYCKWLHENKAENIAVMNWNAFYNTKSVTNFNETYKIFL